MNDALVVGLQDYATEVVSAEQWREFYLPSNSESRDAIAEALVPAMSMPDPQAWLNEYALAQQFIRGMLDQPVQVTPIADLAADLRDDIRKRAQYANLVVEMADDFGYAEAHADLAIGWNRIVTALDAGIELMESRRVAEPSPTGAGAAFLDGPSVGGLS